MKLPRSPISSLCTATLLKVLWSNQPTTEYWLVDGLMAEGYAVHLANPAAIQKYSGLKHADDKHDAFWLAEMLRLNILPTGYIYPKDERPIRDLLRKRGHLVSLRSSLMISLQNIFNLFSLSRSGPLVSLGIVNHLLDMRPCILRLLKS